MEGETVSTHETENTRMKTYMSIRQTAQFTGLGESYLRRAVRNNSVPGFYVAGVGSKFMVNVPLLLTKLDKESQNTLTDYGQCIESR